MTLREVNRVGEGQKNVPQLRFKGYEDAWEQRRLGEITEKFEYGLNAAATDFDGVNQYLRITDIDDETREFNKTSLTSPDTNLDFADNYILKQGDILFARTGASVGKTYQYKESDGRVYYAGFLIRARLLSGFNVGFIFQNTLTKRYENFISITSQRSGQPGVNAQEYASFKLLLPKFEEQEQIADLFTKLDNLITLHQRKYDALKSMKKTLLSKMFPKNGEDVPEIRFKEFTDAWEQRKLGEIVISEIKGSAKAEMIGGDTPYLETNYLNGGECLFVDSENNVDTDDVIVLWDGSQAGTVYHGFSGALGSTFKAYKTKCLGLFIFQQLKKNQQTIYDKYRTPNIPHVIKTFKDEYDVMLTSEEEQNEIGRYFQQIDHLITLHQRRSSRIIGLSAAEFCQRTHYKIDILIF